MKEMAYSCDLKTLKDRLIYATTMFISIWTSFSRQTNVTYFPFLAETGLKGQKESVCLVYFEEKFWKTMDTVCTSICVHIHLSCFSLWEWSLVFKTHSIFILVKPKIFSWSIFMKQL